MNIHEEHRQLLADYKKLLEIGAVYDETGGFLPDEVLPGILESPTKRMACSILHEYIEHWFKIGIDAVDAGRSGIRAIPVRDFIDGYPHLWEIADRYGMEVG